MNKQPKPNKNNTNPALWDLIIKEMKERDDFGYQKYGVRLKGDNGRDMLQDAIEEALDLLIYLRGIKFERDGK